MLQTRRFAKPQLTFLLLISTGFVSVTAGCGHKSIRIPAARTSSADNSYMDLEPGWRLRILVPLLASGGYRVAADSLRDDANTIVLSAANLVGYEISYYRIEGKRNGKVRLEFTSAETTKNGKTVADPSAPALPFSLPAKSQYVRLIYLVRVSGSDHNMAIAASESINALNLFTAQVKQNPAVCKGGGKVFCSWVPAGVAVRPEPLSSKNQ